jgi:hypothetical protein
MGPSQVRSACGRIDFINIRELYSDTSYSPYSGFRDQCRIFNTDWSLVFLGSDKRYDSRSCMSRGLIIMKDSVIFPSFKIWNQPKIFELPNEAYNYESEVSHVAPLSPTLPRLNST